MANTVEIMVGYNTQLNEVTVTPPRAHVRQNGPTTLVWKPKNGIDIAFIGFTDPVGQGRPLGAPTKDQSTGQWSAADENDLAIGQFPVYFKYTVWVEVDGVVFSKDPEIVNDPPSGA